MENNKQFFFFLQQLYILSLSLSLSLSLYVLKRSLSLIIPRVVEDVTMFMLGERKYCVCDGLRGREGMMGWGREGEDKV